ncbi:PQ loop repeat-domain-containing protein, partial [Lipomyces oligophaga]|uniref:PQ loop repeat-domain-containing protein n=1 Tax=Lipomyces oligophaga TaxID=45792 RepID=UPI0034CD38EC
MDRSIRNCPLVDDQGEYLVRWIARIAGSCVYDSMGEASFIFGYMSLFSWLGAQLPQVIKNWRNHSVEGVSWLFLFNWLLGDATNLLGCLLTNQLFFQTLLATYYLSIDVILCSQYVYYTRFQSQTYYVLLSPPDPGSSASSISSESTSSTRSSQTIRSTNRRRANVMLSLSAVVAMIGLAGAMLIPPTSDSQVTITYSTPLIAASEEFHTMAGFNGLRRWFKLDSKESVGRVFAWICTVMYLTSRMPQIYTNFVRQSTSGLSVMLFVAAFLGNTFYTLSILTNAATMEPLERSDFLWDELPYLLGSAGTVGFDSTIFIQWIYYGEGKQFFHNLYYGRKSWEAVEPARDRELEQHESEEEDASLHFTNYEEDPIVITGNNRSSSSSSSSENSNKTYVAGPLKSSD